MNRSNHPMYVTSNNPIGFARNAPQDGRFRNANEASGMPARLAGTSNAVQVTASSNSAHFTVVKNSGAGA